jgi:hypothetical protein
MTRAQRSLPQIINGPLDFELKGLDPHHPSLKSLGLTAKTIEHFGIGYCGRGMLAGRIAIPLHDSAGKLVGYAGRVIDEKTISATNPEFKFPDDRERQGAFHLFRHSLLLYNGHRQQPSVNELVVVRDFTAVWWLHQAGIERVVALMDTTCSHEQAMFIGASMSVRGRVWVLSDGNKEGNLFAQTTVAEVSLSCHVRVVKLGERKTIGDCSPQELKDLLH